jgi:hypothetical protein
MRLPDLDRFSDPAVLRRLLGDALRRAHEAKMSTERFASAVRDGVRLAVEGIRIPPVPRPRPDRRAKKEEVANPVLADWQLAKVTPTYNSKVCERRVGLFAEKVIDLARIQRAHHPVRRAHVWALGDLVEGELIFPGQAWRLDDSLNGQTVENGPRIIVNFIRTLLTEFESVHVTAVPGNHGFLGGRNRKEMHPDSNADRMLYHVARQLLREEPRVTWTIAGGMLEGGWFALDDIGGYRTLLFHGDQIRGGLTTENHLKKLILGWKAGAIRGGFQDAYLGHFHVVKKFTFNATTVRVSGSPESDNAYAVQSLGSVSRPSQPLQFVRPGFGVTAEYSIWLDREIA